MHIPTPSAERSAIVLIDYVSAYAPLIGTQTTAENVAAGLALTQIAQAFGLPLVVTLGPPDDPRGGLYPELTEALGEQPLCHRGLAFDAFKDPSFVAEVEATGRRHLIIAGLMTDGCVLQTTLSALRRDYEVSIVVDATATLSVAGHEAALGRMAMYGAVPTSWLSLAAELQGGYDNVATMEQFRAIQANSPGYAKLNTTIAHLAATRRTES